jgi:hypothetical protein
VTFEGDSDLEEIGTEAFCDCECLERIRMPKSLRIIGDCCFRNCQKLGEAEFESDSCLESIGDGAFMRTALGAMQLPPGVEYPGAGYLEGCQSPCEITFIPGQECAVTARPGRGLYSEILAIYAVHIPAEVEIIEPECFERCWRLHEVTFATDSRLRIIRNRAFSCSRLERIRIPKSVQIIGYSCFESCQNLGEVEFEADSCLEEIRARAFCWCRSLEQIRIPKSVKIIGDYCFDRCRDLGEVVFESGSCLREIGNKVFSNMRSLGTIRIPAGVERMGTECFKNLSASYIIIFEPASTSPEASGNDAEAWQCVELSKNQNCFYDYRHYCDNICPY